MQEYLHKSRLSGLLDSIGFHFLSLIAGVGWFVMLWGLRLPAVTAGLSLYGLIVLLRRKILDDQVVRKEQQLRRTIGGELALERLLLSAPGRANFELAMLLSLRYPLLMLQAEEEGVVCVLKGKRIVISLLQLPGSSSADAAHVLSFQRILRAFSAERGILCVPCKITNEARNQAQNEPFISFLSREKLISLLGSAHPADDGQLIELKKLKKTMAKKGMLKSILSPKRGRHYACYGALLLFMYLLTRLSYYAVPGMVCVFLAAACRCVKEEDSLFIE